MPAVFAAIAMHGVTHAKDYPNNSAAKSMLQDVQRALETYRADYGAYPPGPDRSLVADTRSYVACLLSKGQRGQAHLLPDSTHMPCGTLNAGELTTRHGKPFFYTFPAKGVPGPDGKTHDSVDYYLWTWGCRGDGPEAAWEINNWTKREHP